MNGRTIRSIALAVSLGFAGIVPLDVHAEPAPAQLFTVDEVREQYLQDGLLVDKPITWWSDDQVTTMRVTDPYADRVLMVLVYPDSTRANAARWRTQDLENEGSGRLVRGFGISAWIGNVAIVESSGADLRRLYDADQAGEQGTLDPFSREVAWQSAKSVDPDFLSALDRSIVNL